VAGREHVGVGAGEQRRDSEAADLLAEVEVLRHRGRDLVEQPPEALGPRRDAPVEVVHRRVAHEVHRGRAHLALLGEHVRVDRAAADVGREP
jgi:hypothetical protein